MDVFILILWIRRTRLANTYIWLTRFDVKNIKMLVFDPFDNGLLNELFPVPNDKMTFIFE